MKLKVINVAKATGISKKTGNAFEILNLSFLSEFETANAASYQREGAGFSVIELPVSNSFYPLLEAKMTELFKGQPVELDIETSVNSRGTIAVGFIEPGFIKK